MSLISRRLKPKTLITVYAASVLGTQNWNDKEKKKFANSLFVLMGKNIYRDSSIFMRKTGVWAEQFPVVVTRPD